MQFDRRYALAGLVFALIGPIPTARAAQLRPTPVDFIHQVQPILKESCYSCHGPEKSKGGLRLDVKARALKGGDNGPAIVAGNSSQSPLIARITTSDADERMPQKAEPLSAEKIKLLRDWIDQGAVWPEAVAGADPAKHWAFQPLTHPEPPMVKNKRWARTPVDNFIQAKLEEKKLTPNPPAKSRAFMRRAHLDLVGFPPSPSEVDAFVSDKSRNANEKLIDRLLASPQYGERWARHWLDVARFAESDGFEQDTDRTNAFWYRDFVIKALNDDMPFDQFVKWQLAGDEFAPDDPWALAATGFLGAGQFPTQLTEAEFEPARYDELDNMAATTGTAVLGLTVGCARCHDHKFDPISNTEYYRLVSTFTTTIRSAVDLDFEPNKYLEAKTRFDSEHAPLVAARDRFEQEQLPKRFSQWLKSRPSDSIPKPAWFILEPTEIKSKGGATFARQDDGSFLASGKNPDFDTYTFVARTRLTNMTAIRIEALADPSFVKNGPGRAGNANFDLTDLRLSVAPVDDPAKTTELRLTNPQSTFDQNASLKVAFVIDDDKKSGWAIDPQFGKDHAACFEFDRPVGFDGGTLLTLTLDFQGNNKHNIGRLRVALTTEPSPAALCGRASLESLAQTFALLESPDGATKLTPEQQSSLAKWYRQTLPEWVKLDAAVREHAQHEPHPAKRSVMVTSEGFKPLPHFADDRGFPHFYKATYFLKRGDVRQKGEVATQGFLKVLNHASDGERHWQEEPPASWRTSYRRRALANWITDTHAGAGQLMARVIVNRLWQHHFGRGIVATPNDFGLQGGRPTHPELLDWLANDLIQHGWKLKRLHKLIMLSSTYLQSANEDATRAQVDRENRLLWHWPRHRLEGEAIRDSILAISGQLDPAMFGPGSLDPMMRRRSIYFFIKRSQLIPILMLFDFPEPNVSIGQRVSTTIAPQALAVMNNPQFRACAHALATRLSSAPGKALPARVEEGYRLALGRRPDGAELANAVAFIERQTHSYRRASAMEATEAALVDFCQVLFGLNEFIYLE